MADQPKWQSKTIVKGGSAGGLWFIGFIGALVYYFQFHATTFWLIILGIIKAIFWPGFLVYYLLKFMHV